MAQSLRLNIDDENTGRLSHKSPTSKTEQTITSSLSFSPHIGNNHRDSFPCDDVAPKTKNTTDQSVLNQLEEFIHGSKCLPYHNNINSMPPISQMATTSSNVHNQSGSNMNSAFQLSPTAEHSPHFLGNKSSSIGMNLPPSHINNQISAAALDANLSSTQLDSLQTTSNSVKQPPTHQHGHSLMAQPNQYNQYNSRQDMIQRHGYPNQSSRALSLPSRGSALPSHYESHLQRYMSQNASLPQQTRPIPSQTPPRYPSGYTSQDLLLNSHGVQRTNSGSDGNLVSQHYPWPQRQQQLTHSQATFPSSPGHTTASNRSQGMSSGNYDVSQLGMVPNPRQQSMMHSQYQSSSHAQQQGWLPPGLKPQMQGAQHSYPQQSQYNVSGAQHNIPGQVSSMMQKPGDYPMYTGQQQQQQQQQYSHQLQEEILRERNRKYQAYQQHLYLQQQQQQQQRPPHILPKPPPSGDMYNSQYQSKMPQGGSSALPEYSNTMVEERNSSSFPGSSETVNLPGSMPHLQTQRYPSLRGMRNSEAPSPSMSVEHSPMRAFPEPEKLSLPYQSTTYTSSNKVQPPNAPYTSPNSVSYMPTSRGREPLPPYNIAVNRPDLTPSRTPDLPVARGSDIAVSRVPNAVPSHAATGSRRSTEGQSQSLPFPHRPPSINTEIDTGHVPSPTIIDLPTAEDVEAMIEKFSGSLPLINDGQNSITTVNNNKDHDNLTSTSAAATPMETEGEDVKPIITNVTTTSAPSSPSDSFPGISPAGSPSGVSISSLEDEFCVGSMSPWSQNPSQVPSPAIRPHTMSPSQYDQIYKLYDIPSGGEKRKQFLDKYLAFMDVQGSPVSKVPVIGKHLLDLYRLYSLVKERGGIQEVVKKKQWKEIVQELDFVSSIPNAAYFLHSQYMKYLMHFENKGDVPSIKKEEIRDIKSEFVSETETPPPNTTVSSKEEVIVPRQFPSGASTPTDAMMPSPLATVGHSSFGGYPTSEMMIPRPSNYSQGYAGEVTERSGYPVNQMSSHSTSLQQSPYPYSDMMRYGLGNVGNRSYPVSYQQQQQQASAYTAQRTLPPRMQHVQQHAMQQQYPYQYQQQHYSMANQHMVQGSAQMYSHNHSQASHEQVPPHWPQQYYPNQETDYGYDRLGANWPPNNSMGPSLTQHHLPSPANPYSIYQSRPHRPFGYRPNVPPHMSPPSSMSAQHEAAAAKSRSYQQPPQAPVKRDVGFPPDCVESTKPIFTKRRKLASRDLGPVEAWRVMMSLKSGLLAETTWALDVLNILLYDDHTIDYFLLSRLPGLLDNLVDHFRRCVIEIFGLLKDNEIDSGALERLRIEPENDAGNSIFKELWVGRDLGSQKSWSCFIASHTTDKEQGEGFDSGSSDWHLGGGDLTLHIQTRYEAEIDAEKSSNSCDDVLLEKDNLKENRDDLTNSVDLPESPSSMDCSIVVVKNNKTFETLELDEENCSTESKDNDNNELGEEFIQQLKEEMDLDVESISDDEETVEFLENVIPCSSVNNEENNKDKVSEEESNRQENVPLCLRTAAQESVTRRCVSIANIIRGLSFVSGNDGELSRHAGLLLIFSKLLLLHHKHPKRVQYQHSFLQEDRHKGGSSINTVEEWWRDCLEALRENALVTLANIAGQLDITFHPEVIHAPMLSGLIHWCVCHSAAAVDPMSSAFSASSLSPRQLSTEALAKMSILRGNVDLIITALDSSCADEFFGHLVKLLGDRNSQVNRELSLVLLSNLSQASSSCIELSKHKSCIQLLLGFLEDAESTLASYTQSQSGFRTEEFCGTTLGMLRRAAQVLVGLSKVENSAGMFLAHQDRLLSLATSGLLDASVVSLLDEVLFFTSR